MSPYNGYGHPQTPSSGYSAYSNPTYGGYNQPYGAYNSPPNPAQQQQQQQQQPPQRPFRLHDDSGTSTPVKSVTPIRVGAGSSTLPSSRRLSENLDATPSSPLATSTSRPSYSRQTSRD